MEDFQILVLIFLAIFSIAAGSKLDTLNLGLENYEQVLAVVNEEVAALEAADRTVAQLIQSEGYPVEEHTVTTTDGYILMIHRIPTGKKGESNGKVAFLQHGLLSSSADWLIAGSEKALGYILADAGYDVWLGNARGNTQSRKHISLNPDKDSAFWQFSWHEIGIIDVPQMIDYVLGQTKVNSLYYVGHSQGTTTFFVMTSRLPEYNEKIKVSVSLAPIAYMNHLTSPLMKILADFNAPLSELSTLLGVNEFLPQSAFMDLLSDTLCSNSSVTEILCSNVLFAICGFSPDQMNSTLLPIMMHYTPAGSSTKQFLHYAQEIVSGKFRQYDFGAIQNVIDYGNLSPPDYPLGNVTTPVHLIYSHNDWLSAEVDVQKLCTELSNCEASDRVTDLTFNHLDYMYGIDAKTLVYNNVINVFNSH